MNRHLVLNACRRHRLGRVVDDDWLATLPTVLNACRRHRLGRGRVGCAPCINSKCSTPVGVIVWGGTAVATAIAENAVLNACRRHRLGRLVVSPTCPFPLNLVLNACRRHRLGRVGMPFRFQDRQGCSTPVGVIVWGGG